MAIKKIKLPGMAQPVDIGTTWANVSGKPDLVTSDSLTAAINAAFATNDAMIFKGTIGAGGTVTQLPAIHEAGWTYKVITNGSLAGQPCEIGDMIVCVTDGEVATADDWTVIQTNVDGAVTGPASSTAGHIATFTGTTGKAIQDSGFTIAASVPADAQFTDTTYENKTAASGGTDVSLVSTGDKYNWNNKANKIQKKSITLSTTWSGDDPYTQVVTISGYTVTANSKIDLQPDAATVNQLITDGVKALYIENNNSTLTAYAIGAAPTAAMTIQCTVAEVTV